MSVRLFFKYDNTPLKGTAIFQHPGCDSLPWHFIKDICLLQESNLDNTGYRQRD